MNNEQIICPNCQQVLELCECDFEIQEQFLRDLRNKAFKELDKDFSNKGIETKQRKLSIIRNGRLLNG